MAIANAVERGAYVFVYNEKGAQILMLPGELHGYTSSTISIRRGAYIFTFNERGAQTGMTPAR
jgi:hypothetical protein